MARRRRDAPDPTPDPAPQQQPAPAPDSAWAEKLAHAVAQARTQVDALSAAQQALATSTAAATQSQTGLAAALASVAAQSRKGAPGATPPASGGGAGQPPPAAAPPGATGGPGRASPAAPPAGLGAAVAQAARSQQVFGDAAASAAAKTGTLARSQGGLAGAVGGASDAMGRMASGSRSAADAGGKLAQSAQAVKGQSEKMATAGLAVAGAYAYASAKLLGFVKAGLAGTTTGELLSFNINQLHRQIASLFLPVIEGLIKRIQALTDWFRGLSGEQQQSIARWSGLTVGMLGALTILPKLVGVFGLLGAALKGAIVANPFLAVTGALVALLSRTEEGRGALKDVGSTLLEAFKAVAELIAGVLIPVVEALTDVLSGPAGKILLWGTIITAVGFKVVSVFAAIKGAALAAGLGISGAFAAATLGVGALIAGVAALLANSNRLKEFEQEVGDIAKGVRSGQTPREEAQRMVKQAAQRRAFGVEEQVRFGGGGDFYKSMSEAEQAISRAGIDLSDRLTAFERAALHMGPDAEGFEDALGKFSATAQEAYEKLGRGVIERAEKGGKGRSDLVTSRTGQEDVTAVIRRLEESVLKTDVPKRQLEEAEKQTTILEQLQKMMDDMARRLGVEPRPIVPPLPPVIPGG
jgi:hypothetical protein